MFAWKKSRIRTCQPGKADLLVLCLLIGNALPTVADENTSATPPIDSLAIRTAADDWPCWRGARRDNHTSDAHPPVRWSQSEGVVWKVPIPGRGHATPCIWRHQILVATADERSQVQS